METVKKKFRNMPKEIVITHKMELTAEQKKKIEDMVVDLLVAKIKAISIKKESKIRNE